MSLLRKFFAKIRNYFIRGITDNQQVIIDKITENQQLIKYQIIENQKQFDKQFDNIKLIIENQKQFEIQIKQELNDVKSYLCLLIYINSCQSETQNKEGKNIYQQNDRFRFNIKNSILRIQDKMKHFIEISRINNTELKFDFSDEAYKKASILFDLLTPMDVVGGKKIRLGGSSDGSYVTIEPELKNNNDGIAYSFGISTSDPWSMEMAERGYNVFQYDGTIENSPDNHPMIHFFKFMITGSPDTKPDEKNLKQILNDHGHHEKNIMLNIDIEGAEWDFFDSITKEEMLQFEQIIVEFHGFSLNDNDQEKMSILKKINETHQCIHLHGNNCAPVIILKDLNLLPTVMEASYIRKDPHYEFIKCCDEFPGKLDFPNAPFLPDIYLGFFNI
jgi:hypothetical protein